MSRARVALALCLTPSKERDQKPALLPSLTAFALVVARPARRSLRSRSRWVVVIRGGDTDY
ncbi:hypothetical protein [Haladaptatus paucihalophilus]|uniref:hypothetical protein n=1 Tax=Haladaptatus paucihalophilus TaxID=367189 RepID=UPI0011120948|nr:hypothetical protein [Haladaptatus paucihalophilus]